MNDFEQLEQLGQRMVTMHAQDIYLSPGQQKAILADESPLAVVYCGKQPEPPAWVDPVSTKRYPPARWYCAQFHRPGVHTGLDLNLEIGGRGDVERRLGLSVYAIAAGRVYYVTDNWSGVGMVVVEHEHNGAPLYVRYAHITPVVAVGETVKAGDKLGAFADWRTGDHLHFDVRDRPFTREWLSGPGWLDPVPILKAHLSPSLVDAILKDDLTR